MKTKVLLFAAGAALFGAGYFTRSTTHPAAPPAARTGPIATALDASEKVAATAAEKAAATDTARRFIPGRPFPKGGAKLWLMSLSSMEFHDESDIPQLMEVLQTVMTMDEDCTREMAAALVEIAEEMDNPDSAKTLPHADELVEGGMMISLMRLSQFSPESALELIKKKPEIGDEMPLMFIFGKLAARDPQHAAEVALTMPEEMRSTAMDSVLQSLAGKDPHAALALAAKYPEESGSSAVNDIMEKWAAKNPTEAMTEAIKISGDKGNSEAVRRVFDKWLDKDEKAATAWAAGHQGPGSTAVQAMLLERQARADSPTILADYGKLQAAAKDPKELEGATSVIASKLAEDNLDTARAWVESLPAGVNRDTASTQLVRHWLDEDVESASAWIRGLPPGEARDSSARLLSDKIMKRDPASALEWARNIQDESLRNQRVKAVLESWEEHDPDAAKAALQNLPQEMRPKNGEEVKDPFSTPDP